MCREVGGMCDPKTSQEDTQEPGPDNKERTETGSGAELAIVIEILKVSERLPLNNTLQLAVVNCFLTSGLRSSVSDNLGLGRWWAFMIPAL